MTELTPSGLDVVGPLPWGTHLCQLYDTAADLKEFLVPYFKAGLEANESCLWIASDPLPPAACEAALRSVVPDLERRKAKGQIEILGHDEWYLRQGAMTAQQVLDGWLAREAQALDRGYAGLRLTGNTFWLEPVGWRDFQDYESAINGCFHGHRITALCSYCMRRCDAEGVLDIVENHHFAVARRRGQWSVVESASYKATKAELLQLNQELENRVLERTRHLTEALSDRDVLLHEVHHRVRNNLQVIISLLRAKRRQIEDAPSRSAFDETVGRVHTISLVHDELHKGNRFATVELGSYLGRLCNHLLEAHGSPGRLSVIVEAADIELDASAAVSVGLVVNELVWNACKHAFPGGCRGRIQVTLERDGADLALRIEDDGVGLTVPHENSSEGLGMAIATRIAAQLGGTFSIGPAHPFGTLACLRFPMSKRTPTATRAGFGFINN
ncbi:sensor histidine kinase [Arenibaculum pallidiluteum]|uniref:sensor histidine kinase n=1 Tax=Arenibaculum pallidiluteum TaxID=2812559 RepID=UPI001A973872|nr:MEDS domain-containing protein [Arenibaculum pallidiluteum]